ncbi:MAG TPA: PilT/PilU family type 4a pilus ATPase [Actinomycetota bacterium]|nr:PilT/PilU family type 4a pilus ATPase [Actinomycetota bacterium]
MSNGQRQLSDVLLEQGLVTSDQLTFASQEEANTGKSAWKVLLEGGVLTERDLVRARALQIGLRFFDTRNDPPSAEAMDAVPEEVARRQLVLPMRVENGTLVVAMAEPTNRSAVEEVQTVTGRTVAPAAAYRSDLAAAIDRWYSAAAQVPSPGAASNGEADGNGMSALHAGDLPLVEAATMEEEPEEEEEKEPDLAAFLMAVLDNDASDLHLTAGVPPMIRVHGEMRPVKGYRTLFAKDLQEMIYSILTQRQREIFEDKLELDISYSLPGRARFRVNVYQQRDAIGCVMRIIPFEIKNLETLGLPPSVSEFAKLRRGLVLVTGITGSGKSTTLAGLIDIVNSTRAEHIMTVEDPIEFLHKHKKSVVNQREVGTDTHGFSQALKHVLRQDPDVILVGELRDLETISAALTAAETGHLVFGTLHTQDAPQSVDRVIDVFPPHQQQQIRVQLAGTLAGVVSQQLLPTVDGKGRVVAAEVLVATPAVRNLIREGKTHQIYSLIQTGGQHGMQTMDASLAGLVRDGRITMAVAETRASEPAEMRKLVESGVLSAVAA